MSSVTYRISNIIQPRGGYLSPSKFETIELQDKFTLHPNENINASIMGIVVDYMTRFMKSESKKEAFSISLKGAKIVFEDDKADIFLSEITGLDDKSLLFACKLARYDTAYREGIKAFKSLPNVEPNSATLENIRIMIKRSLSFVEKYGPIKKYGFTFGPNGYTSIITHGDGDFLTKDTMWDFKVSKNELASKYTLQLVIYYLMGKHSGNKIFDNITNIGFFNPRKNKVYIYDMNKFDLELIKEIEEKIIGYKK